MSHTHPRILLPIAILGVLFALRIPALAQGDKPDLDAINKRKTQDLLDKARDEYRVFFKKPETGIEYWSAIKFEMDLGKFDLAAYHLKLMLEKEDKNIDADLVKIEQAEGMSAFFRLKGVRPKDWSDHEPFRKEAVANVEKLLERVTKAVETHLSDPERIRKFIKNLDAPTEEERGFAYVQLARSRERAIPYLIEAIRTNYGKTLFPKLRETLIRIGPETVPVYLEAFKAVNDKDYRDVEMRLTLLDIIQKRDDPRVIPYLWHMYGSKRYPDAVRKKAKETLASLLRIDIDNVPPAKESLTALAERYYQHKIPFKQQGCADVRMGRREDHHARFQSHAIAGGGIPRHPPREGSARYRSELAAGPGRFPEPDAGTAISAQTGPGLAGADASEDARTVGDD